MELTDYWRIVRNWYLLIAAGTVLALLVGLALHEKSNGGGLGFQAQTTVRVNEATPYGVQYNPSLPTAQSAAGRLSQRIHDPGALAPNPHVAPQGVSKVYATVSGSNPTVKITVAASSLQAARTGASNIGKYLVQINNHSVAVQAGKWRHVYQAKARLLHAKLSRSEARYYTACGCVGAPPAGRLDLERMYQAVQYWQNLYTNDLNTLQGITTGVQPATTYSVGAGGPVAGKSSSLTKTVLPAVILGFILSFALAAGLDHWQYSSEDVIPLRLGGRRSISGTPRIPVLGQIGTTRLDLSQQAAAALPNHAETRLKVVTALGQASGSAAEILGRLVLGRNHSLYVTSPTSRDPKAETVIGLAAALTAKGRRVVIVDADPQGGVTAFFGLAGRPGLTDYLGYPGMALAQLLYQSEYSPMDDAALMVLPLGVGSENRQAESASPDESSPQDSWKSVLSELSESADIVLVNGPAVLEDPDAPAVAREMGGGVIVIRKEHADKNLAHVYDALRRHDVRVLGLVVNPGNRDLNKFSPLRVLSGRQPVAVIEAGAEYQESS